MKHFLSGMCICAMYITLLVGCKKNDAAPSSDIASFTIDGKTIPLNGASTGYLSVLADSLLVLNSNTTDSSVFDNLQIGDAVPFNYSLILITSNSAIKVGTYTSTQVNLTNLIFGMQYQNQYHTGGLTSAGSLPGVCTVNITNLTDSTVSGTYNGTIYNSVTYVSKKVSGSFKASL